MSTDDRQSTDEKSAKAVPRTLTVSLLYRAGLQGLKLDQTTLIKEAKAKGDHWYFTTGEEVSGPIPSHHVTREPHSGKTPVSSCAAEHVHDSLSYRRERLKLSVLPAFKHQGDPET